jgi:hypothetical protein
VPASDVRALTVLVTTALVSAETKALAARNNRLTIVEGG